MKKIVFFCLLVLFSFKISFAHNPLSAMYYLEVENGFGILNLSLTQSGLHNAIFKSFSDKEISEMSDLEYKKQIVDYIKANFYLIINDNEIKLLEGGMKLGNHQTDLKFITSKLPSKFNTLDIKIDAFKENEHHQTVFSLVLKDKTSKVILSESNNYETSMSFENNRMISNAGQFNKGYFLIAAIILIPIIVRNVFLLLKKNEEVY